MGFVEGSYSFKNLGCKLIIKLIFYGLALIYPFSVLFISPLVFLQRNTVWNEMHISYILLGILQMKTLHGFVWDISKFSKGNYYMTTGHFTVVCFVPWPLNRRETGGDLVLLQTCLLFKCKSWYSHANKPVNMTIYIWKTRRFVANKVTASLASIQRPGHWAHNCKMAYFWYLRQSFTMVISRSLLTIS